ncbi:MAG: hypothetical protein ONB46_00070 [candidate division KSB1 bacterium]|nr:hypothetical protein [candidate division KSB1 bacterium]MDZ7364761.1 hypothetical protein [candidate division KSB1 bacterium]MDZ7402491.1 hypothetical protein [candidate division KSB1 bacterium]
MAKLIDVRGRLTTKQVQDRLIKETATAREKGMPSGQIFLRETEEHIGCSGLRPDGLANARSNLSQFFLLNDNMN